MFQKAHNAGGYRIYLHTLNNSGLNYCHFCPRDISFHNSEVIFLAIAAISMHLFSKEPQERDERTVLKVKLKTAHFLFSWKFFWLPCLFRCQLVLRNSPKAFFISWPQLLHSYRGWNDIMRHKWEMFLDARAIIIRVSTRACLYYSSANDFSFSNFARA